jgi:hypothetical protein
LQLLAAQQSTIWQHVVVSSHAAYGDVRTVLCFDCWVWWHKWNFAMPPLARQGKGRAVAKLNAAYQLTARSSAADRLAKQP